MADFGSLEGGWAHIQEDPMAFIQQLLTPRNVQRRTELPGGSHFGPDRNASIPQENFAMASQLLDMLGKRDQQMRASEVGKQADQLVSRRLEAERMNLSPGSIRMGGRTEIVPGKIGVNTPLTPTEMAATSAGGYEIPSTYGRGSAGSYDTTGSGGGGQPTFKDKTDRIKALSDNVQNDQQILNSMVDGPDDPNYAPLKARITQQLAEIDRLSYGDGSEATSSGPRTRKFGDPNINDLNGDGYVTAEEAYGPGGPPVTQAPAATIDQGNSTATIDQGNSTFQPKQVTPFTPDNFAEGAGFVTDPNAPPPVSEMDKPWYERGGLAATTEMLRSGIKGIKGMNERAIMKEQGINPETGELITPDDRYAWSQLKPWIQEKNLQILQSKDSRMENYPPYQRAGG